MKLLQPLLESSKIITRLNCSNCQFLDSKKKQEVTPDELNEQGGVASLNKHDLELAKKARLITLPGKASPKVRCWCTNEKVNQWVTEHMWCTWWEAPGTIREFEK